MTLDNKIDSAKALVLMAAERSRKPVVMSSFGKDSMVLLHLLRSLNYNLPVLFHREPFFPHKYKFANRIIQEWGLTVYDFPPLRTSVVKNGATMEIMNEYQYGWLGQQPFATYLPTGVTEPTSSNFLCGKEDLLQKPTGSFNFAWDCVFIGHKASDVDPISGPIPVQTDVVEYPGTARFVYPLREFTDDDVWDYHVRFSVPVHHERYDIQTRQEHKSKEFNPDYFEACTRCIDRDEPHVVTCPKSGLRINNIAHLVRYSDPVKFDYFKPQNNEVQHVV